MAGADASHHSLLVLQILFFIFLFFAFSKVDGVREREREEGFCFDCLRNFSDLDLDGYREVVEVI